MLHVRPRASSRLTPPLLALLSALVLGACERPSIPLTSKAQTWAELRVVRRDVTVQTPDGQPRAPYPRERLVDGESVTIGAEGVAWIRRDAGATFLVHGPAKITLRPTTLEVNEGKLFVDTPGQKASEILTPSGPVQLSRVRASIDVAASGATSAYVLSGEVRAGNTARAGAGELLTLQGKGAEMKATAAPVIAWDDWTGGLATTDRAAEPAPYGVGTVGARLPGSSGSPRFPLAIERLDVKVTIDGEFATTEVDEVFFNPSSQTMEGVYRFRTPGGASLQRFGVDRGGAVVWGRVKEKQAASAQYESNVYAGSKEDPALLEWEAPGSYRARLYPIGPGEARRVVVRYSEWLGRTGAKGERRMYVYPMAAEGAEGSLPAIEELSIVVDLAKAGAKDVRAGMAAAREDNLLVVRDHDVVPRADLAVELFDDGPMGQMAFTAPHTVDAEALPPNERDGAKERAKSEADYVIVPVRAADVPLPTGGLDLAIVIDASAATDTSQLALARAQVAALLAHLGKDDRAVVWAGDVALRPVVAGRDKLAAIDDEARRSILTGLAQLSRGGATDLGAMLSSAAEALDPARRGAVVYIGDGTPTVGELSLLDLRERLAKLPRPVRIFGLGVGDDANMALLSGLARGAFAERIGDANSAARAALRLFEQAERPVWLGAKVDLGSSVERIFPRDLGAQIADETLFVIGRVAQTGRFTSVTLSGPGGDVTKSVTVSRIEDGGDLRRRWAEARLYQMMDEATGRAAMVDLGVRHGIITPVTSLYVPTTNEMSPIEREELQRRIEDAREERLSALHMRVRRIEDEEQDEAPTEVAAASNADNKEGGSGTRAKGEEGSMGNPNAQRPGSRYAVAAPAGGEPNAPAAPWGRDDSVKAPMGGANADPHIARQEALKNASEFGMIGLLNTGAGPGGDKGGSRPAEDVPMQGQAGSPPPPPAASAVASATAAPMPSPVAAVPQREMEQPLAKPKARAATSTATVGGKGDGAQGNMWGNDIGDGLGSGGLGLNGVGVGGGGRGEGWNARKQLAPDESKTTGDRAETKKGKLSDGKDVDQLEGEKAPGFDASGERVNGDIAIVSHVLAVRCSAAASLPLDERAALWRERLEATGGNPPAVKGVYERALGGCEAPSLRDRARLLQLMLDVTKIPARRVQLWRLFMARPEADTLYRGMLARVRTPDEMRDLHSALGLRSIDSPTLKKLLDGAKTPADRVTKLRALVREWPDDFTLALLLLDALEDADDADGARDLGKRLRARPDADARLRTAVGELFLRLAERDKSPEQKATDEAEARRAFGEIVEFAPDDPVARRRLGDLLRAHGWFDEAARQYQTLAKLTPDDPAVHLLLAASAEGLGKLEEAVRWAEKAGASGAPDLPQSSAQTARALAVTYLAWERDAARAANRKDDVDALSVRAQRLLSGGKPLDAKSSGTRVTLVWSHPDLHPTLWTNALGAAMPAQEQDATAGVAHAVVPRRDDAFVEVRIDPEDAERAARLGATATLTVILREGEDTEKIKRIPIKFATGTPPTQRLRIVGEEVTP
ncbi:MAG: VIT domain-containing protein [Polyangiaceae bacterium]